MKEIVKFSEEERKAIETIASISCEGITCCNCPLSLADIPFRATSRGCYRNYSVDILRANELKED